jgi:hypothetical protein
LPIARRSDFGWTVHVLVHVAMLLRVAAVATTTAPTILHGAFHTAAAVRVALVLLVPATIMCGVTTAMTAAAAVVAAREQPAEAAVTSVTAA